MLFFLYKPIWIINFIIKVHILPKIKGFWPFAVTITYTSWSVLCLHAAQHSMCVRGNARQRKKVIKILEDY